MIIDNDTLIKEFYNTLIKPIYPHIPLEEVDRACKSPFYFARYHMKRNRLNSIRIKQFGTFVLYPNKILRLLEVNDYNLVYGAITSETHQKAREHLLQIYSEALSVKDIGEWGRKLDIIDTTDDNLPSTEE